jgi:uncharacterized protein YjdB
MNHSVQSRAFVLASALVCAAITPSTADAQARRGPAPPAFYLNVHVQDAGDSTVRPGEWAGTKGQSKRLEAFWITKNNLPDCLTIKYMAHVEGIGDMGYVNAPSVMGTTGRSLRVEGVAFKLAGSCAAQYTIEYQCHIQDFGDSGVMSDGEYCGTRGQSRRIEALRVNIHSAP